VVPFVGLKAMKKVDKFATAGIKNQQQQSQDGK
jgi:hypothetical protein